MSWFAMEPRKSGDATGELLPHWSPGRIVFAGTALMATLFVAALAGIGWYEHREAVEARIDRGALLARVLDDHATGTLETAAVALTALAELIGVADLPADPTRLNSPLTQALAGLPFMRSIALLDMDGRVLASSVGSDVGRTVELEALGSLPTHSEDTVGPFVAGRHLADVRRPSGAVSGIGFIPVLHKVPMPGGRELLLVGLVNPGAFSNYQSQTISRAGDIAVLALPDGRVIASAGDLSVAPISGATHPVFREHLGMRDHDSYVGEGFGPGRRIVAFRASGSQPLVTIVEQSYARTVEDWLLAMFWIALIGVFGLVLLVVAAVAVWRSLRAREAARRQRDAVQARAVRHERELTVLIKSVQELIFRTDAQGAITFVNARWSAVSGQSADQALGRRLHDLVDDEQRAEADALFAPDGASGLRTAQLTLRAADGREYHFQVAVAPLLVQGRIAGFAGSAVDVTERWAAKQRLQAQLAFTGLLLEISPVPVSMTDAEGRITTVNQTWEEFFGCSRADVVGRPAVDLLQSGEAGLHAEHDRQLMRGGGRVRFEAKIAHGDGSLRDVVVTKVLVPNDKGDPLGILTTVMDVSEFRDAERATREARNVAEEASRTKSEFIANISHELRTPLQSILGFSELGLMRGRHDERLAAMFQDIHAAGERMLALVNDLLDVSKIESAVGTFHLERVDLRGLVRSVAAELDPLLQRAQLRLHVELSEAPLRARVDPLRFQQVVRNVLANAIKFSPTGQRIDFSGHATPDGEIHLRVRDHGPGIPPAELDVIFDAFVQSSATKNGAGGTGLGLAICRKIVEAHGGRIRASNAMDGGGVFDIHFPARPSAETQPIPIDEA